MVFELKQLLLSFEESFHLSFLVVELLVVALVHLDSLCLEAVFQMLLLFSELSFHLFVLHLMLLNRLRFLIDLLLQCASDLHHLFVVLLDLFTSLVHILLEVLKTDGPLIQTNVQRSDVAIGSGV